MVALPYPCAKCGAGIYNYTGLCMKCGYNPTPDPQATRIATLEAEVAAKDAEIAALTKDRDGWKIQHELYVNAWFRALDHRLWPKRHQVDALAITTQRCREKADLWDTHLRDTAEQRTPGAIEYASWSALQPEVPGGG